jgi:hypothetical protein
MRAGRIVGFILVLVFFSSFLPPSFASGFRCFYVEKFRFFFLFFAFLNVWWVMGSGWANGDDD